MTSPPVSIVILTHNEVGNLHACLDSVSSFDDVHVLDSGSTDGTEEIAKAHRIDVSYNPFVGFGTQRNWALDHIPTRYDWQFHLDADERMTPALTAELAQVVAASPPCGGYRVPSKLMFAGRWLKRAGQYPGYQVRFFHKSRLRFMDYGHGQREVTEFPLGTLKEPLIHFGFSKGLDDWFTKHIRYARREAEMAIAGATGGRLFSHDGTERRRAIKRMTMRLPGRYFLRLGHMLLWRRAILDGWAGVSYAHMVATYEGMIDVYLRLLKRGLDPDKLGTGSDPL
ncbi:MAG: glycosyltransferase [Planctomycetaceae bacterium]|nr:glycosyltransferase [Planctomycetaceae bacterium]